MLEIVEFLRDAGSNVYILLLYSAAACVVYYVLPKKARNGWLLVCSVFFYAMCSLRFLLLVLAETAGAWLIGRRIEMQRRSHGWLIAGVMLCIGILGFFKYYDFFLTAFEPLFRGRMRTDGSEGLDAARVIMPIGISYYSFRIISYLADIDMGKRKGEPSPVIFAVYVLFFPQLLSGPIARSEDMTARMHRGISFRSENLEAGVRLIISGMFKKVVIADRIAGYPTTIFASPEQYPATAAWLAAILYSLQLYCDFAGYSEIAIGITRCFGFDCPDNFIRPYLSTDMKDFWHRWHASLGSWLRDYVYIPCGGSRVDRKWKVKRNVMITFAVCGLWHGSGLKYLVWGLYHGVWNILVPKRNRRDAAVSVHTEDGKREHSLVFYRCLHAVKHILQSLLVFLIAMFGWILFKADSFAAAAAFVRCMFRDFSLNFAAMEASILPFTGDNSCVAYALTAFLMLFFLFILEVRDEKAGRANAAYHSNLLSAVLLAIVLLFSASGTGSFLYVNY